MNKLHVDAYFPTLPLVPDDASMKISYGRNVRSHLYHFRKLVKLAFAGVVDALHHLAKFY
ncbi:hypothetical protein [Nostoc sp.]|uniref:hypothetical protein n=1 Tax=Nostoc sp. TaxID=1180 RepID=UPI002FFBD10D